MQNDLPRRGLLAGAAALGGAAAAQALSGTEALAAPLLSGSGGGRCAHGFGTVNVAPGDPRYDILVNDVFNTRFVGSPESVRLVDSTDDVEAAVRDAVGDRRRVAVRSGGHCYENFSADPAIDVLVDMSEMDNIYHDPEHNAIAVEAGAELGQVYLALFKVFGATIPAGTCPAVGVGGHVIGGGYGFESRQLGAVVDYIHGVEVVVVDHAGRVRAVTATRDRRDPNRDLWWAHTGGGGGNFGVVTRVFLRAPDAVGTDPTDLLPRAAPVYRTRGFSWQPGQLDERAFTTVLRNFGAWHERNSAPNDPGTALCPVLTASGVSTDPGYKQDAPSIFVATVATHPEHPDTERLLTEFATALTAGVGPAPRIFDQESPLVPRSTPGGVGTAPSGRYKLKAAYHRRGFTAEQLSAIYRNLSRTPDHPGAIRLVMDGYGGRVNAVARDATALAQRDSVFMAIYDTGWPDKSHETAGVAAVRRFYREVYAATGGVPATDSATDGSYINYPDVDLADPAQNTSGIPWHTLYYKDNYPRLQRIKAQWDPRDIFHHTLAVRPPQ